MMCANDPHAPQGAVCLTAPTGAFLTIILDGLGEPMAVIAPTCEVHMPFISIHLEEICIADGIWVRIDQVASAADIMREALGMPVHVTGTSVAA